jgi:hypothetical protein
MAVSSDVVEAVGVVYPEGLDAVRWLERAVLLAVEQKDMTSAFCLLAKLQSFVLSFLLSSLELEPSCLAAQRREYLSVLSRIDKAISRLIND